MSQDSTKTHPTEPDVVGSEPTVEELEEANTVGILMAIDGRSHDAVWVHDPDSDAVYSLLDEPTEVARHTYAVPVDDGHGYSHMLTFHDSDGDYYQCLLKND